MQSARNLQKSSVARLHSEIQNWNAKTQLTSSQFFNQPVLLGVPNSNPSGVSLSTVKPFLKKVNCELFIHVYVCVSYNYSELNRASRVVPKILGLFAVRYKGRGERGEPPHFFLPCLRCKAKFSVLFSHPPMKSNFDTLFSVLKKSFFIFKS